MTWRDLSLISLIPSPQLPCTKKPRSARLSFLENGAFFGGGSYRDRTDDIHGVNVALYQLS